MIDVTFIPPAAWTAIAERPRQTEGSKLLRWRELPEPLLSPEDARALAEQGTILMANRHLPDRVELVIRGYRPKATRAGQKPMMTGHG
jgi:hypothetical protein